MTKKNLQKSIQQQGYTNSEFKAEIAELIHRGLVDTQAKGKLSLNRTARFYTSTLEMKPAGFGFAINSRPVGKQRDKLEDPYISRSALFSARHGDKILILVTSRSHRKNPEAEVLGTIEHGSQNLTGFLHREAGRLVVHPEDPRYPFSVLIDRPPKAGLKPEIGDAVIVKLAAASPVSPKVCGRIIEVLGSPNLPKVQLRLVIEKYGLLSDFSLATLREAEQIEAHPDSSSREDLRAILHYTIDGEDAKDFDDGVGVVKVRHGYRLYVSIADVAAYVKPGSSIDSEAYARGTSIYFPDSVLPMLPENLSNNLCSLLPDKDRLAVTAILDFDRQGTLLKKKFCRSIIRSSMRFTYTTVKRIIDDRDAETRRRYKPFLTPLKWARELAEALQHQRMNRGSVSLTIPEQVFRLDADGGVAAIETKRRSFANQLIEEFMLAANEAVAQTFAERGAELLYRIHEQPDPEKIKDFATIAQAFGLSPKGNEPTPEWYNDLASQVKGTPRESILNSLLLRTLQQARYSADNKGHFGLGADHYAHFTSPIRRYPDLIVHRLLVSLLSWEKDSSKRLTVAPCRSLKEAGLHLSDRERNAISAEREMAERLKCRFMEPRLGEHFKAIVSSISDSMFFIDLVDLYISGAVLLSSLNDDYYLHDWKRYRLVGDITGKVIQIGDIIDVELIEVDIVNQRIYFTPSG